MKKYVDLIKNNLGKFFVLFILINILSIIGILQIKISTDFSIFMPKESIYQDRLDELNEYFPQSEQLLVMIDIEEFNYNVFLDAKSIQEEIMQIDNIDGLNSFVPDYVKSGLSLVDTDDLTESDMDIMLGYYDFMGEFSLYKTTDSGNYGIFTIFVNEDFTFNDLDKLENIFQNSEYSFYMAGDKYSQLKILDYILIILSFLPVIAIAFIVIIFRSQLGSIKPTILSILPAGIGTLWMVGLIGWIGREVSIITVLAPIFTIVIGSADGLHFISHIQDSYKENNDLYKSIIITLKSVGKPMIITTLTSIIGFVALFMMNTSAIIDLAIFTSVGVLLAGVATWYVIPLLLLKMGKINIKKENRKLNFDFLRKAWGLPVIIILFIILGISSFGYSSISTEFNMLSIYKSYTEVSKNNEKIMEVNGGAIPVFAYVEFDGDILDEEIANEVLQLEEYLINSGNALKAYSVYDFYMMMGDFDAYPSSSLVIGLMDTQFSSIPGSMHDQIINTEDNVAKIIIYPKDLTNQTLNEITSIVSSSEYNVKITGLQFLMKDLNENMVQNQLFTTFTALILVFIIMLIFLRKLKETLISMVPIVFTTAVLYGLIGVLNIPLNIMTTTIFAITLGVGIDYAAHFTSIYIDNLKDNKTNKEAVLNAFKYSSAPIVANALGLSLGLSALFLSPLKIHVYVATLMWLSMILGVILSLTVLPTIFSLRKDV